MKLIEFKEYNNVSGHTLNKKKVAITVLLLSVIFIVLVYTLLYSCSPKFRNWTDMHVLMKTVYQGKLATVDTDSNSNSSTIVYDKYVALLNNNKLDIYNPSGNVVSTIEMNISNPMFASNGKHAVIAEKEKEKIYLLSGNKMSWTKDVDGSISRVDVNENGYVSVVCSGTTYKAIVIVFDQDGKELFKTYIPTNKVVDCTISSDNKYLSFAEVDTSGTLIKSSVKTISIKDAKSSSDNAIVNKYEMPTNSLVIDLKYQGSKNLICMCDDSINVLTDGKIQKIFDFKENNKSYSFAGIELINSIYEVEEVLNDESNQSSNLKLINTGIKAERKYAIPGIAKSTLSNGDITAVNLGTEVYFVDTKGWLRKKYVAAEEIRNVAISNKIAAIIFRDHIEILVL